MVTALQRLPLASPIHVLSLCLPSLHPLPVPLPLPAPVSAPPCPCFCPSLPLSLPLPPPVSSPTVPLPLLSCSKAGRGRSTAVVLAYLVLYRGMPPHEAHDHVKRRRAHISERWSAPELQACWRLRQSLGASRSPEQYSALLAELGRLSSPEVHARLIAPARSHEAADAAAAGTGGAGAGAARPASAGAAAAASASGASAADVEPRKLR